MVAWSEASPGVDEEGVDKARGDAAGEGGQAGLSERNVEPIQEYCMR